MYQLHDCESLFHHICNGVYDCSGNFGDEKMELCNELFENIKNNPEERSRFKNHLANVFYNASSIVFDCVSEGTYNNIRKKMHKFDDY